MIVAEADIRSSVTPVEHRAAFGLARTRHLSDSGGLRQFAVHDQVLEPGASSSRRHWHAAEDEFALVLEGAVTLEDDRGRHVMGPGDAAAWPHGSPNAHRLLNESGAPCRYLIVGSRAAEDVCTYPDDGRVQVNHLTTWEIRGPDGSQERAGDLAPELLNLSPAWGRPYDGAVRPSVIRAGSVPAELCGNNYPEPYNGLGRSEDIALSDAGGLSQFGAFIEILHPGGTTSQRHWHEAEDEFLYVLDGRVTLIEEDGPQEIGPGAVVCWPAGVPNAHCLRNDGTAPTRLFIVGARLAEDACHYPDIDLHYTRKAGLRMLSHKDGRPYPTWPRPVA